MSDRRVFVSGAAGFVGRHLCEALVREGFGLRALEHRAPLGLDDVVRGELEEVAGFGRQLEGCSAVVHCAALLDPVPDERAAARVNHFATVELARVAIRSGVGTFVFLSSQAAIDPVTAYGRSKLAAERSLAELADGSMRIVVLRPPTVYGPGERRNFLALVRALDSGLFAIPGRGKNRMSFCAVDNLTQAIVWALREERARGTLHVSDEPVMTFRETCQALARVLGRRLLPLPFPLPAARAVAVACEGAFGLIGRDPPLTRARLATLTADHPLDTRATAALGFRPATSFEGAARRTVGWYRDAGLLGPR